MISAISIAIPGDSGHSPLHQKGRGFKVKALAGFRGLNGGRSTDDKMVGPWEKNSENIRLEGVIDLCCGVKVALKDLSPVGRKDDEKGDRQIADLSESGFARGVVGG
jgi:hypothetical protein